MNLFDSSLSTGALMGSVLAAFTSTVCAQSVLRQSISALARQADGSVSVSCLLPGSNLNCDLNSRKHSPMQSVFKYPLVLTVLHLAETGKLFPDSEGQSIDQLLDRKVRYLASDRIPNTFSPLQDRYPDGNVELSLRELITLTAGQSDNVGSEVLLRIAGGPAVVDHYIQGVLGPGSFQLKSGEREMASDPQAQYSNWMEAAAAVQLLQKLVNNPPLRPATNAFLLKVMTECLTGPNRLRAGLPVGTPLAHRTGTCGSQDGLAPATNDVGLVTLPDGRHLTIAVFITDAHADEKTRDAVIAQIGHAAYEAALATR